MGRIRTLGVAAGLAIVMAVGMGTTAQAANKKPGDSNKAICEYLEEVINYPYVTPSILKWALSLWDHYKCAA